MGFGADGIHSTHRTGFRGNSNRARTIPARDWANYPGALGLIIQRLQGVVIEHRDALEVIQKYDGPETLHYVDPPYVHCTRVRVDRARGYRHELSDAGHRALGELLNAVKGSVVLSGYDCALYEELFAGWKKVTKSTFADGARQRIECLWIKT